MASDPSSPFDNVPADLAPVELGQDAAAQETIGLDAAAGAPVAVAASTEVPAETPEKKPAKVEKPKPPKPPMSVYGWMLVLTFVFLAVATAALAYELKQYNFEIRPGFQLIKF